MLVGRCVMRMAESVLLTCWPPAPLARKVSTRRSAGLISISMRVVHLGIDEHAGEGGVAARVGVERRLAHQAVHAGLGAQRAVGVVAAHLERRALDAGDFAGRFFQHLDREAAPLAEAQVHALEHGGPVLRLGAAGAGLDVDEAVVRDPSGWRTCGGTPGPPPLSRSCATSWATASSVAVVVLGARHLDQLAVVLQLLRRRARACRPPLRGPCAPCRSPGRAWRRTRGPDPRPAGLLRRGGCAWHRSQRYLRSSAAR